MNFSHDFGFLALLDDEFTLDDLVDQRWKIIINLICMICKCSDARNSKSTSGYRFRHHYFQAMMSKKNVLARDCHIAEKVQQILKVFRPLGFLQLIYGTFQIFLQFSDLSFLWQAVFFADFCVTDLSEVIQGQIRDVAKRAHRVPNKRGGHAPLTPPPNFF